MSKKTLGIWGAGGLGREVLELAKIINTKEKRWDEFIFIVDNVTVTEVNGEQVLSYEDAKKQYSDLEIAMGIGEPGIREEKFRILEKDGVFIPTLIHPSVYVPNTTIIGRGVVIQFGCFVSCNVTIGDYVFLQPQCNIGHDDKLARGCIISGFGNLAGNVSVGEYSYLGLNVVVREGVSIGSHSIIGMGSVVHKDIEDDMIAMGNPARPMKKNDEGKVFKH